MAKHVRVPRFLQLGCILTAVFALLLAGLHAGGIGAAETVQLIAFTTPDQRLMLTDAALSGYIPLTARDERVVQPRWSPDGGQIAYTTVTDVPTSAPRRDYQVQLVDVIANRPVHIDVAPTLAYTPPALFWTADSRHLIHATLDPNTNNVQFQPTTRRGTTLPATTSTAWPAIAPHGSALVYGDASDFGLMHVDLNSGTSRQLYQWASATCTQAPHWDATGTHVLAWEMGTTDRLVRVNSATSTAATHYQIEDIAQIHGSQWSNTDTYLYAIVHGYGGVLLRVAADGHVQPFAAPERGLDVVAFNMQANRVVYVHPAQHPTTHYLTDFAHSFATPLPFGIDAVYGGLADGRLLLGNTLGGGIYLAAADGSAVQRIGFGDNVQISPRGDHVMWYYGSATPTYARFELVAVNNLDSVWSIFPQDSRLPALEARWSPTAGVPGARGTVDGAALAAAATLMLFLVIDYTQGRRHD